MKTSDASAVYLLSIHLQGQRAHRDIIKPLSHLDKRLLWAQLAYGILLYYNVKIIMPQIVTIPTNEYAMSF